LAIIGWAIFAGRPYNHDDLRTMYRSRLISFNGIIYLFGGESHIGIDCSGLARAALYESMIFEGFRTGNPKLIGPEMWDFWRHDISAKAMGEGAYGYTYKICDFIKLAGADPKKMKIGDLAVTESGLHVLIYLGDSEWIQAAPGEMKVFRSTATPNSTHIFFQTPVKIMRWKWL
jgi:cell wall-associated NlpC family hydrolase